MTESEPVYCMHCIHAGRARCWHSGRPLVAVCTVCQHLGTAQDPCNLVRHDEVARVVRSIEEHSRALQRIRALERNPQHQPAAPQEK